MNKHFVYLEKFADKKIDYLPEQVSDLVGLTCFRSEDNKRELVIVKINNQNSVFLEKIQKEITSLIQKQKIELMSQSTLLKIKAENADYSFYCSIDADKSFISLGERSGNALSGDLTGCVLRLSPSNSHSSIYQ